MNINSHLKKAWKEAKAAYASNAYQQTAELKRCLDRGFDSYCRDWMKVAMTGDQLHIAKLLETYPYRVLVPSANNTGKSFFMSAYARYFYDKYNPGITMITGPTDAQVKNGVFKELRVSKPKIDGFKPKDSRAETAADHYIHGFTTNNPDAFQGRHEHNVCLMFDESTAIDYEFVNRGKTMAKPQQGHAWICCYNPNDPSTWPYSEEETGNWHVYRLSALTHPNIAAELQGLPAPIPSAITLETVLDRLQTGCDFVTERLDEQEKQFCFEFPQGTGMYWRPRTQAFEAQILGRWPLLPTESILSPAQVDKCINRMYPLSDDWQLVIGCDIARFGADRTAIVVRRGPCVLHVETFQKRDSVYVIDRLKLLMHKYAVDEEERRSSPIFIDDTGGYGGGVLDHMPGYRVIGLHMNSKPPFEGRTGNMRTFLWFNVVEMILSAEQGKGIDLTRLDDNTLSQLRRELTAPRYRIDEQGKRKLEPKAHIKDRLGISPDIADAFAMAFYLPA